ncbi:MAG: LamG-like jellyroll fold domain-containing protein [Opitutales bacterium]
MLPIRINTWDGSPEIREVSLFAPSSVDKIYLQVHGLRFGGQLSVRVNDDEWLDVYNHSVELHPNEAKNLGIGGTYSTIRFYISGESIIPAANNHMYFRLNGIDGFTTGLRIIDIDFLDASGASILPESALDEEDPGEWAGPYTPDQVNGQDKIDSGEMLWSKRDILFEDFITKKPIRASCADCHFDDGSDLKYFNFANETIISRARFHGLSEEQGKQIASYIRNINLKLPKGVDPPGRPWNPPFQPGPGTDWKPGDNRHKQVVARDSWLAGKGLDAVKDSDREVFDAVFSNGADYGEVAEMMDTMGTLSMREIPMTVQLPDWNQWLPRYALIDIWPDDVLLRDVRVAVGDPDNPKVNPKVNLNLFSSPDIPLWQGPIDLYNDLHARLADDHKGLASSGLLNNAIGGFTLSVLTQWYGNFRDSDKELDEVWQATKALGERTYDEMRIAVLRWRIVKTTYLVREFKLETLVDEPVGEHFGPEVSPNYTPEPLMFPSMRPRGAAWAIAPHISAKNQKYFEEQSPRHGKAMSYQWYQLQQILHPGFRRSSAMNNPLDWAYIRQHNNELRNRTGHDLSMSSLFNFIKMAQSRRIGVGVHGKGFSMRTTAPNFFFAEHNLKWEILKNLNNISPGMHQRFLEEYLYEFIDVMAQYDTTTMARDDDDRNHINTVNDVPRPWHPSDFKFFNTPDEDFLTSTYRLLPLLLEYGINPAVIEDFVDWLMFAYPKHSLWDSPPLSISDPDNDGEIDFPTIPYWDEYITPSNHYLYRENFEDGTDAGYTGGFTIIETKNAATYTHDLGTTPRGSGGRFVGRKGLAANSLSDTIRTVSRSSLGVPAFPGQRLKISLRTAFRVTDENPAGEEVRVKMTLRFDNGQTREAETRYLNPALFNKKFETYESEIIVPAGATQVKNIDIQWIRTAGGTSNSSVFFDNILIQDADPYKGEILVDSQRATMRRVLANQGDDRITIRWNAPSDLSNIEGYNLYRWVEKEDIHDNSEEERINLVPLSKLFNDYTDRNVEFGVPYRYRIGTVGVNGDELEDESDHLGITLESLIPDIPVRHQYLEALEDGTVRLSWFGVPDLDNLGYSVFRRPLGAADWELMSGNNTTGMTFDDLTVLEDVSYEYYVSPYTFSKGDFLDEAQSIVFNPYATAVERAVDVGLIAYVNFDGGVTDSTGNLIVSPHSGNGLQVGAGIIGDAYRVTQTSERVNILDDLSLNTGESYPLRTISLWFKLDAIGGPQTIYEEGGGTSGIHIYLIDDTLYAGAYDSNLGWEGTWKEYSGVSAGEWHHVALVLDADISPDVLVEDQLFAYFNGIEIDPEDTAARALGEHGNDSALGGVAGSTRIHDGSARGSMVGLIDEFALWNRALSHREIAALAGQRINYTLDSFRSRYLLASDGSDDYKDWSGNGITNIAYYFFGLGDPRQTEAPNLERGVNPAGGLPVIDVGLGAGDFEFSYVRNKHQSTFGYQIQYSEDLETWSDLQDLPAEKQPVSDALIEPIDEDYEIVSESLNFEGTNGYFRVEVSER